MTTRRPTVLIADDHRMLADVFERILMEHYEVVGKVADGRELIKSASQLKPDVIVLDISMPRLNGLDAAHKLRRLLPDTALVVVTMHADPQVAAEARRADVSGFVTKSAAASELTAAVEAALAGKSYLTPLMCADQVDAAFRRVMQRSSSRLTPRQREVLQLMAEGLSMKQVAAELELSIRTVAHHKYKLMEEQGIDSNAGLVQLAIQERLIDGPQGTAF